MNSDQISVHYVFQSARGAVPASPALKELRVTTPDIGMALNTVESAELSSDRQIRDIIDTGQTVNGNIGLELSYSNADDWIEAAMCGTWQVKPRQVDTAVTATTFTVPTASAFKKGHLIRGYNHANAANNGLFKLAADGTGTTVTVTGAVVETPPAASYIKAVGFEAASGDMVATVVNSRLVLTISSASGVFTGMFVPGEWVKIGGPLTANQFATAGTNGWGRIFSVTATALTFDVMPSAAADTGVGKTIRLSIGDMLTNGVTRRYAAIQRRFNDHTPIDYENTIDQEAATLAFAFRPGGIATASLGLMGGSGAYTTTQYSGATNVAAPTRDVMNTADDIGALTVNGVAVGAADEAYMTSLAFSIDNRLRDRTALARRGAVSKGLGRLRVTGSADFYFANLTLANLCQNNKDVGLSGVIGDATVAGTGSALLWDIPAARLAGDIAAGGADSDVMLRARLTARKHTTLGWTIALMRFDELV